MFDLDLDVTPLPQLGQPSLTPAPAGLVQPVSPEVMFTSGWCHVLALEVHDRTGWPVVVVSDGPHGPVGWVHAGVQLPDGRVLDVRGAHDPLRWLAEWEEVVDAYGRDFNDQRDDVYDYDSDRVVMAEWDASGASAGTAPAPSQVLAAASTVADQLLAELGDLPLGRRTRTGEA